MFMLYYEGNLNNNIGINYNKHIGQINHKNINFCWPWYVLGSIVNFQCIIQALA